MKKWTSFRHPAGRLFGLLSLSILAAGLQLSGCGDTDGGGGGGPDTDHDTPPPAVPGDYGGECKPNGGCDDGAICHTYSLDSDDTFCTMKCASDEDCPQDGNSSCISVTAAEGLTQVCVPNNLCIDPDNDGYGSGPGCKGRDCDQTNPNINPGAPEYCNGIDDNCNDIVDDNAADVNSPCSTGFPGVCAEGWTQCIGGSVECLARVLPGVRREICDDLDNDCDGYTDEGPPGHESNKDPNDLNYVVGIGLPCGNPDSACFGGYQFCNAAEKRLECSAPVDQLDVPDLCDGIDNNCDGRVDEDANDPDKLLGTPCSAGIGTCRSVAVWTCNPNDPAAPPVCAAESIDSNSTPEVCDYTDNNCNDQIDEGFRNAAGAYDQHQHCGRCGNNCAAQRGGNPAALGLAIACEVEGTSASCKETCLPQRYDLDKRPDNGCEFEPDSGAIYVTTATRGGANSSSCGDFQTPCLTINHAITRAKSTSGARPRVRVSEGIFRESLAMENGISVIGGHSSRNWLLDPMTNVTTVQGQHALGAHVTTVEAVGITAATEFSGFTVDAGDASAGGNSYGIYIANSTNALTVKDNRILAGRGGVGTAATSGTSGKAGGAGGDGKGRVNDSKTCSGSPILAGGAAGVNTSCGSGIDGGEGAKVTVCPATSGSNQPAVNGSSNGKADDGQGTAKGIGGRSQLHTTPSSYASGVHTCNSGTGTVDAGTNGGAGNDGAAGAGATNALGTSINHWQGASGGNGGNGALGSGGGGGGSSGGIYDNQNIGVAPTNPKVYHYGPTGGGGGAGGCGGTSGQGGAPAGGSFGIFVVFSGASSNVPVITGNEVTRNSGGRGGTGGAGGAGGSGGAGGEGGLLVVSTRWSRCGLHATRGGAGGRGGHAGGGGGGAGGASFDIATAGNSNSAVNAYQGANTYSRPNSEATGGQGGAGGTAVVRPGTQGTTGASGNFHRF